MTTAITESRQIRWQKSNRTKGACYMCGRPALNWLCAGHTLKARVRYRKKVNWGGNGTTDGRQHAGADSELYAKAKQDGFNVAGINHNYLDLTWHS